jgi:hypothetical protein
MKTTTLAIMISLAATIPAARAGNVLPSGVEPLSSQQVTDKYSGHTVEVDFMGIFFSRDGTVKAYASMSHAEETAVGKWTVNGNEFCYNVTWKSKHESTNQVKCKKHYKFGSDTIIQETKDTDSNYLSVYPDTQFIFEGDKVSDKYMAVEELISE